MPARQTTFDRIADAKARMSPPEGAGDPGLFELWTDGQAVGTVALLPTFVERRAVLMDAICDHLNTST
jgi:hypothetical protein